MIDFTFYYGCASGSSRKALRKAEEPNVFISFATKNNKPWDGIENLFLDSGGAPDTMKAWGGEYPTSDEEYLDYVEKYEPEYFALRDYPCEKKLLREIDRTVEKNLEMTIDRHINLMDLLDDRDIKSEPVSVIQGKDTSDYLKCIEMFEDHNLITPYIGIGTLCGRSANEVIKKVVKTVREQLPNKKIHGFGIKKSALKIGEIFRKLDSADSQAYEYNEQHSSRISGNKKKSWLDSLHEYYHFKKDINKIIEGNSPISKENRLESYL